MVDFKIEGHKLICIFKGSLDTVTAMQMENPIDIRIIQTKMPTVFDMRDVHYVCSGFLRICMRAIKAVGKENFSVIHSDPFVKKVFKVAGLEQFLIPEGP
jgi:anti-anti-sigma factor